MYLGIEVEANLGLEAALANVCARVVKRVHTAKPFLSNRALPARLKVWFVRNVICPVATYGAQIWGTNSKLANKLQSQVNVALRLALNVHRAFPATSLLRLSGVIPISVAAQSLVVGAGVRWRLSPLLVGELYANTRCCRFAQRRPVVYHVRTRVAYHAKERALELTALQAAAVSDEILQKWSVKSLKSVKKVTGRLYHSGFLVTDVLFLALEKVPHLFKELGNVARLVGYGWSGASLEHHAGRLGPEFKSVCPFCGWLGPETAAHYLLRCPAWTTARATFLVPVLSSVGLELGEFAVEPAGRLSVEAEARRVAADDVRVRELLGVIPLEETPSWWRGRAARASATKSARPLRAVIALFRFSASVTPRRMERLKELFLSHIEAVPAERAWRAANTPVVAARLRALPSLDTAAAALAVEVDDDPD